MQYIKYELKQVNNYNHISLKAGGILILESSNGAWIKKD